MFKSQLTKFMSGSFLLIFCAIGCSQGNQSNENQDSPNAPTLLSDSQRQLQSATYSSETEKKALSRFITGSEFCEKYKSVTAHESGFYVTVPVDYDDPSKGTTKIWAYFTSGAYDPKKPVMIYFDGGSGGNSHGQKKILNNFNELHYDQRGIGCSHPETLALYRDPSFYSNENNARDADEIRKFLKVDKVSLYGASYGTVVATIYAAALESNTTAVVLDGTVYSDEEDSKIYGYYLKKMYTTLPEGTKVGLKKYLNSEEKLTRLWSLARILMYNNDPFGQMKKYLTLAFPSANEINQAIADKILGPDLFDQVFFGDTLNGIEAFNNQMLNCKNQSQQSNTTVSLFGPYSNTYLELYDYTVSTDRTKECKAIFAYQTYDTYRADRYRINVPVVYFQGNLDGATFAAGAIQHYKKVPTGKKQLLIAVNGGHCPGMGALMEKKSTTGAIEVVEAALRGQNITAEQMKKLNAESSEIRWVYTSK